MNSLPMVPSACSLDQPELRAQLARYRRLGERAKVLEQSRRRLVIRVGNTVPDDVVESAVAVERRCCPCFVLDWESPERRLSISVSKSEDEPALHAIADALGLSRTNDVDDRATSPS